MDRTRNSRSGVCCTLAPGVLDASFDHGQSSAGGTDAGILLVLQTMMSLRMRTIAGGQSICKVPIVQCD